MEPYVIKLAELGMNDVEIVGGKNASLGEMISNLSNLGVTVPGGFATTSAAYRAFLATDGLDKRISDLLDDLDVDDIDALTNAGQSIRQWILDTPLPQKLRDDIDTAQFAYELYTNLLGFHMFQDMLDVPDAPERQAKSLEQLLDNYR